MKSRGFGGSAHPNAKPFSFPAPPAHPSVLRCWNKTEVVTPCHGSSEGNFAPCPASGNSPDPQVWCQHIPAPRSVPGTKGCPFPRAPLESVEPLKCFSFLIFFNFFFYQKQIPFLVALLSLRFPSLRAERRRSEAPTAAVVPSPSPSHLRFTPGFSSSDLFSVPRHAAPSPTPFLLQQLSSSLSASHFLHTPTLGSSQLTPRRFCRSSLSSPFFIYFFF